MKVIAISIVGDDYHTQQTIYGLGDNGKVYVWNEKHADWDLFQRMTPNYRSDPPF